MTNDPTLWLSISATLLATSLTVIVVVTIPVVITLSRTAQNAEKLLDTLNRELPATLSALRSTGEELSELTEDLGDSVESAKQVVQRVDQGMSRAGQQWQQVRVTSKGAIAGLRVAWATFFQTRQTQDRQTSLNVAPKRNNRSEAIAPSQASDQGSPSSHQHLSPQNLPPSTAPDSLPSGSTSHPPVEESA